MGEPASPSLQPPTSRCNHGLHGTRTASSYSGGFTGLSSYSHRARLCIKIHPPRSPATILREASLTVQAGERGSGHSLPFRAGRDPLHLNLGLWLGVRGMLPVGAGADPCIPEEPPPLSSPWEVPLSFDWLPSTWDEPELPHCPQPQVQSGTSRCPCCAPPAGTPQGTPTRLLPLPLQVSITVPSSAPCLHVSLCPAHHAFTEQDSPLPGGDQSFLLTSEHQFFSQLGMSLLCPTVHSLISDPVKNLSCGQQTHEKMLSIAHY